MTIAAVAFGISFVMLLVVMPTIVVWQGTRSQLRHLASAELTIREIRQILKSEQGQ